MRIYDLMYRATRPSGMENRKAFIIGGGQAGLAAAAYLADDVHMPAENITILEAGGTLGGSMDGTGDAVHGYLCRGERELEPNMECLWYLCAKVPSLRRPDRTVLDDVWDFNSREPIHSEYRLIEKQGRVVHVHDHKMDGALVALMLRLLYVPETELEGMSIEEYFPPRFFDTNLWWCFHSMLAFKRYHSVIEAKRYFRRFSHLGPEIDYLHGILHTDLNEYEAIIKPTQVWLQSLGVRLRTGVAVTDIQMTADNNTVVGLEVVQDEKVSRIDVAPHDMVFFTNGSMSQNSTFGDSHTVAPTNRDARQRGVFTLWEKLATRDAKFGSPATFISDIDKTKWVSFFPTITDYPQFVERIERVSGSKAGCGGAITIKDSAWDISFELHHKPFFLNQPDNVEVLWGYGLYGENVGNYVKKPMCDCTGHEILTELLYHLGMLDMRDDLLAHTYVSTAMMPYITSQFMPRKVADRPKVVPAGCMNLAFIGQYVETPEDAVFTVETSCRTAMQAVFALTGIDKKPLEVQPTYYDTRYMLAAAKKFSGIRALDEESLPRINPLKLIPLLFNFRRLKREALAYLKLFEDYPSVYPGKDPPPYRNAARRP
jgi:oleate hydratase